MTRSNSQPKSSGTGTIGGLAPQLALVLSTVRSALREPATFTRLGLRPPRGLLLYGPPGTGKTMLARSVGQAIGCPVLVLNGPEIVSKYYGETEAKVCARVAAAMPHGAGEGGSAAQTVLVHSRACASCVTCLPRRPGRRRASSSSTRSMSCARNATRPRRTWSAVSWRPCSRCWTAPWTLRPHGSLGRERVPYALVGLP